MAPEEAGELLNLFSGKAFSGLLDVGCGYGRLGRWLADEAGCEKYFGLDNNPESIDLAAAYSGAYSIEQHFAVSTFEKAAVAFNEKASAGLSHDALYLAEEIVPALRGASGALLPGALFVFTVYVGKDVDEGGVRGRSLLDWLSGLRNSGFSRIEHTEISDQWRNGAVQLHRERLRRKDEVLEEMGPVLGGAALQISARMLGADGRPAFLKRVRRYRICAVTAEAGTQGPMI